MEARRGASEKQSNQTGQFIENSKMSQGSSREKSTRTRTVPKKLQSAKVASGKKKAKKRTAQGTPGKDTAQQLVEKFLSDKTPPEKARRRNTGGDAQVHSQTQEEQGGGREEQEMEAIPSPWKECVSYTREVAEERRAVAKEIQCAKCGEERKSDQCKCKYTGKPQGSTEVTGSEGSGQGMKADQKGDLKEATISQETGEQGGGERVETREEEKAERDGDETGAERDAKEAGKRGKPCCTCRASTGKCVKCQCTSEGRRCTDGCRVPACANKAERMDDDNRGGKIRAKEEEEFLTKWQTAPASEVAKELWSTREQMKELKTKVEGLLQVTKEKGEEDARVKNTLRQACERVMTVEKAVQQVKEVVKQGEQVVQELTREVKASQRSVEEKLKEVDEQVARQGNDIKAQGVALGEVQGGLERILRENKREVEASVSKGTTEMATMFQAHMEEMREYLRKELASGVRKEEVENQQKKAKGAEEQEKRQVEEDQVMATEDKAERREHRHPERRRVMEEENPIPALEIRGWNRPNPGRREVYDIFNKIGLRNMDVREVKSTRGERGNIIKVLMWSDRDVSAVMRNKSMLRGTNLARVYIEHDRYPGHWKRVVEEGERGREQRGTGGARMSAEMARRGVPKAVGGPRPDQRRVEVTGRSPEMERSWLDGPMTESHRYIFEQLERERLRAKQNLGNGQKEKVFKRSKRAGGGAPRWERRSNNQ